MTTGKKSSAAHLRHGGREASAIEEPLGIPAGRLPRSFGELGRYMDAMLSSGAITITDNARMLARDRL